MYTNNSFDKLTKVLVGDFPSLCYFKKNYLAMHLDKRAWMCFKHIAQESKQDLDILAEMYKDYGVEVYRPKFDPYQCQKWSSLGFRPVYSVSNRFFSYRDLIFSLNCADDDTIAHYGFIGHVFDKLHDDNKIILQNPLTLDTTEMVGEDFKFPCDNGFVLEGPAFIPAEKTIIHNTVESNNTRGIQWFKKMINSFYPDVEFVDVSELFTNHIDNQLRIYNSKLAHTTISQVDKVKDILFPIYPNIEVLDFSHYKKIDDQLESEINNQKLVRIINWMKYWVDNDTENGDVRTGSVSINDKTVFATKNNLGSTKVLEDKGLKVETVSLRHATFWGSGVECETAVLERQAV